MSQVSDRHNVPGGGLAMFHKVSLNAYESPGFVNTFMSDRLTSGASAWDGALYLQDRIEYDFLTVKLGGRFDLGSAGGNFWRNPLDPTNGTTAATVCANPKAWQNKTVTYYDGTTNSVRQRTMSADTAWARLALNCADTSAAAYLAGRGGQPDPAVLHSPNLIPSSHNFRQPKNRRPFSPPTSVTFPFRTP